MKRYLAITTGGTINSEAYDETVKTPVYSTHTGKDRVRDALVDIAGKDAQVDIITLFDKDSKNITTDDRAALYDRIRQAQDYTRIIVTTGTDCMADIARDVSGRAISLPCPVVFTGSFLPLANGPKSDGFANLRRAVFEKTDLEPGVYIGMGDVFGPAQSIRKDYEKQVFVEEPSKTPSR